MNRPHCVSVCTEYTEFPGRRQSWRFYGFCGNGGENGPAGVVAAVRQLCRASGTVLRCGWRIAVPGLCVAAADVCGAGSCVYFRRCVAVWLAYCGAWTVCGSGRCVRCRQLCVLPALCCGAVLSVVPAADVCSTGTVCGTGAVLWQRLACCVSGGCVWCRCCVVLPALCCGAVLCVSAAVDVCSTGTVLRCGVVCGDGAVLRQRLACCVSGGCMSTGTVCGTGAVLRCRKLCVAAVPVLCCGSGGCVWLRLRRLCCGSGWRIAVPAVVCGAGAVSCFRRCVAVRCCLWCRR